MNEKNILEFDIVKDLLPLYVDYVVKPTTKESISEHLEKCEKCKNDYVYMLKGIENEDKQRNYLDPADGFNMLKKKLKRKNIRGMILAILLTCGFAIGIIYFLMNIPVVSVSEGSIEVSNVYVVDDSEVFIKYHYKSEYDVPYVMRPSVNFDQTENAELVFNIKHPVITQKVGEGEESFDVIHLDMVPEKILFNNSVVWDRKNDSNKDIPEYVQCIARRQYETCEHDQRLNKITLEFKDGSSKTWDYNN